MVVIDRQISTSSGQIVAWDSQGSGLPIVMIHGSGASRKVFRAQFDSDLGQHFRLLALDLPGHGDSDDLADKDAYALPRLARTVAEAVDALGLGTMAVYGWSLGGHLAIELMSSHPAVAGIMVSGAPPVSRGPLSMLRGFHTSRDMLLAGKASFSERDVERFGEMCFGPNPPTEFLADIRRADGRCRAGVSGSMLRGDGVDQRRAVEGARVPVAFLNGEHERIVRLSYLDSLDVPTLWRGRAQLVPGAAHSPFFQQPETFNALLWAFANDVAKATRQPAPLASAVQA